MSARNRMIEFVFDRLLAVNALIALVAVSAATRATAAYASARAT